MKSKNKIKRKNNSRKKTFVNGHLRLDKMYLVIALFVFVLISMRAGYAFLNDRINFGKINTPEIEIIDVSIYSKTIGATNLYDPTYTDKTISLNSCLSDKTDSITYLVTIKNNSKQGKKLTDISTKSTNNEDIDYLVDKINISDIIPANTATTFKVKVKYKDDIKTITNKCVGMNINFTFINYD